MSSYKILSWPNMIMHTVGSTDIQSTTCSARGKQYCWQDGSSRQKINLLYKISKSSYILLFDYHFSHPFLGTYEVVQFLELGNVKGTPSQSGMTSIPIPSYHGMETTIPFQLIPYHTIPPHTIPYHVIPHHHSKPVTGCLGSVLQNIKNIYAGCNTDPLGSIFCGLVL